MDQTGVWVGEENQALGIQRTLRRPLLVQMTDNHFPIMQLEEIFLVAQQQIEQDIGPWIPFQNVAKMNPWRMPIL